MACVEQRGEVGSRMIFVFWNSVVVSEIMDAAERLATKVGHYISARNGCFF